MPEGRAFFIAIRGHPCFIRVAQLRGLLKSPHDAGSRLRRVVARSLTMKTPISALSLLVCVLAPPVHAQEWTPVTTDLLRTEKPGFGGLCGVVVDHRTGHLTVNLSDRGFYRSEDQGKTWKRLGDKTIKGRTEWPGCLMLDPVGEGKKLA